MIRDLVPAPARRWVYVGLVVANAAALIWAPEHVGTVVNLASALGLTLASGNVPAAPGDGDGS